MLLFMVHYYSCLRAGILHPKLIQVVNEIGGASGLAQMPHSHIDVGQTGQICQYATRCDAMRELADDGQTNRLLTALCYDFVVLLWVQLEVRPAIRWIEVEHTHTHTHIYIFQKQRERQIRLTRYVSWLRQLSVSFAMTICQMHGRGGNGNAGQGENWGDSRCQARGIFININSLAKGQ